MGQKMRGLSTHGRLRRGIINTLLIGCIATRITACTATELEERCFPLMVMADYENEAQEVVFDIGFPKLKDTGEEINAVDELQVQAAVTNSFAESKNAYEKNLNKKPDYNHLKVLVLGRALADHETAYNEMLDTLADAEDFPRNTYVCIVEDMDALRAVEEKLQQDLGTYLEEFLTNHEEKKSRLLTLGDLLDEQENRLMILYAPYLKPKEGYVEWGGYYAIGEGQEPRAFR